MAVRRATHSYDSLARFLEEYTTTLAHGGLLLPPDPDRGELAPEFKLDLNLPLMGRVGPIKAQVVHRAPDGSVGLRLPDFETEVGDAIGRFFAFIDEVRSWLLATGELVPRQAVEAMVAAAPAAASAAVPAAEPVPAEPAVVAAARPAPGPSRGRGFAVPDLRGLSPNIEGAMDDRSLRDALVQLAVDRVTGLLTVSYPDGRTRYGFWSKGGPVGWRTDPLQEQEVLGVLLYKARQLTKEQVAESLRLMQRSGVRQGEALMEMGVLGFPQLVMVLGKQVEYVLQRVMQDRQGSWTFHVLDGLPEQFLPPPLKVPSLLYRALLAVTRDMRAADLAASLRPFLDRYVYVDDEIKPVLAEVKFAPDERKFLEVAQSSSWRLRELYSVSPLSRQLTACTVWAFNELGFFRYEQSEDVERYLKRVGDRIRRKKHQLEKATYFDQLEVHWICLSQEIEAAYKRLKEEFQPGAFKSLPPDLERDRALVEQRLDEAYGVLRNETQRREYRKGIVEPFMIVQSAELLAKKGEMAIMRHDRREACSCYAKALELTPGMPEYRDGLQRATAIA